MKRGFTLIEILLTLGIIAVIAAVTTLSLSGRRNTTLLTDTSQQIGTLLRQAQSDSMTQSKGATWGVHLDNTTATTPWYSLFYTSNSSYASSTEAGHYALPAGICYATSSVGSGSTVNIIFSSVSGLPSATATITLQLMGGGGCGTSGTGGSATSVVRTVPGKVFFDDFNRTNL